HISLFDIMNAYKQAMDRLPPDADPHEVHVDSTSITRQIDFIYTHFHSSAKIHFSELLKSIQSKLVLVVTMIAILELMRTQRIRVSQSASFEDFMIEQIEPGV
ncbi:MAG: segregation/condensation protein A, partial [FCB group bacterium]|nr:segregation/condensation protein A [FCB group bacterium]